MFSFGYHANIANSVCMCAVYVVLACIIVVVIVVVVGLSDTGFSLLWYCVVKYCSIYYFFNNIFLIELSSSSISQHIAR